MVTFTPPTDESLKQERLKFLRQNKPGYLRQLRKSGELDMDLQTSADATRRQATNLIEAGEFPAQAWYRAECAVICETETD